MLFVRSYNLKLIQDKFLQEVMTQSNSHEHDYSIHCTIFAACCLKDLFLFLFFFTTANLQLFFGKKMKFWDNSHNFYHFGKKIKSRSHLRHLSRLTNLCSKNMIKFRANNHFLFVLVFYSQFQKNNFWHFCYKVYRFSQIEKCLRSNVSPLMSIIWAILILFHICPNDSIILLFVLKMAIKIFLT